MAIEQSSEVRPLWRRLVLALINIVFTGSGLIWLGRYRLGFGLMFGSQLLAYAVWLAPPTRGNEIAFGIGIVVVVMFVIGLFYIWSTMQLWPASKYIAKPFPERWHWPFWLALAVFIGAAVLVPDTWFRAIRSFYFPSQSMRPTLDTTDRAWADTRNPREIMRGDVVVFDFPGDGEYVSRVIALGGERVAVKGGVIYLNGVAVPQEQVGKERGFVRLRERLPGGVTHEIFDSGPMPQDDFKEVQVPAGTIFVMGDNRDNAADSRFGQDIQGPGFVPIDRVKGRFFLVYLSADRSKIGTPVR
jgi:signal peptidase I